MLIFVTNSKFAPHFVIDFYYVKPFVDRLYNIQRYSKLLNFLYCQASQFYSRRFSNMYYSVLVNTR